MGKGLIFIAVLAFVWFLFLIMPARACHASAGEEVAGQWQKWKSYSERTLDTAQQRLKLYDRMDELEGRMDRLEDAQEELELKEDGERMEEFYEAITDPDIENYAPYEKKE